MFAKPPLPNRPHAMPLRGILLAALIAGFTASGVALAQVTVNDPWVRGTVGQQKATGAFMRLNSASATRLVEARSPVAGVVEIHEMKMEDQVMRMRPITGLDVPAGGQVELKPGGFHVMLMDLKQPLNPGEKVPLTLVFEGPDRKRQTVEVSAPVRPLTGAPAANEHKHH